MSTSAPARERQRTVLAILRRAHGEEVTYDELREAGVASPASVISELELAGVPVERCYSGRWLQRASCRLDPERAAAPSPDHSPGPVGGAAEWGPVRVYRGRATWPRRPSLTLPRLPEGLSLPRLREGLSLPRLRPGLSAPRLRPSLTPARLLSALALVAAVVTITILVQSPIGAGPAAHRARSVRAPSRRTPPAGRITSRIAPRPSPGLSHRTAPPPTTAAPAPASASALEAHGHALLGAGQYSSAVPVLRRAVSATGESAAACAQPTGQNCLTYAFALYDLGRALRLSGDPAAAVPILRLRLRINNQRGAVAQELALAQVRSPSAPASELEARGHQLLASGSFASAIPVLRQAVRAARETPSACAEATTPSCLIYAFALYDLGRALRLSGDPAAAVPILRDRLEIDNQRGVVAQELRLAESGASG